MCNVSLTFPLPTLDSLSIGFKLDQLKSFGEIICIHEVGRTSLMLTNPLEFFLSWYTCDQNQWHLTANHLVLTDSCWLVAKVCADWLSSNTLHPMLVFWFGGSSCVSSHMTNSLHLLSLVNARLRAAHIKWSTNSHSPGSDSSADGTPCLASMAFLIVPGITLLVYFPKWHAAHLGISAAVMLAAILCSLRIVWVVASAPFWNRNCTVLNQMCPSW